MNLRYEDGKLQFDTPVIEAIPAMNEQMIIDVGKMTLIKDDEKMIIREDKIDFYFKDIKYAILKQDIIKTKFYKLKKLINNVFKTKFKLEKTKPMLHIIDYELYKKAKSITVTDKESE